MVLAWFLTVCWKLRSESCLAKNLPPFGVFPPPPLHTQQATTERGYHKDADDNGNSSSQNFRRNTSLLSQGEKTPANECGEKNVLRPTPPHHSCPGLSASKTKQKSNPKPNQTNPIQSNPNQPKPNQTKPNQTKPNQTKPNQTKPPTPILLPPPQLTCPGQIASGKSPSCSARAPTSR